MKKLFILFMGLLPLTTIHADSEVTGKCGSQVEITATPKTGYHFVRWNDGNTESSRIVDVTGDATYRAYFAINKYEIIFRNEDGTDLQKDSIEHGQMPSYIGSTPTKAKTDQYTYTFGGWTPNISAATQDQVYTAYYYSTVRSYIIAFVNYDGYVLQSQELEYGTMPSYTGTPTRPATAQYSYTFKGWDHAIEPVSGEDTYIAEYDSVVNVYHIEFVNYDSTPLASYDLPYGSMPVYDGLTPTKPTDNIYTYTFTGWSPLVTTVTGDAVYTAQFASSIVSYTITVLAETGGSATGGGVFPYGTQITLTATPNDCYKFAQWQDGNMDAVRVLTVTEDATYTAQFTDEVYTIHIVSDNPDMGSAEGHPYVQP